MNYALEVNNLNIQIQGKPIIKDANFRLNSGSFTYLLGNNGTGKTTLLKTIIGLIKEYSGDILIYNEKNTQQNVALNISYLGQYTNIDRSFPITVGEMIELACSTESNCSLNVSSHLKAFSALDIINKKISDLSGGQLQKALIARALIGNKPILLLDEPFNNLDHNSEGNLIHILQELYHEHGKTILLVTHDISIVNRKGDGLLLAHERLHSGIVEDVLNLHHLETIK
jgi:zinc transport system ATP-binding protein